MTAKAPQPGARSSCLLFPLRPEASPRSSPAVFPISRRLLLLLRRQIFSAVRQKEWGTAVRFLRILPRCPRKAMAKDFLFRPAKARAALIVLCQILSFVRLCPGRAKARGKLVRSCFLRRWVMAMHLRLGRGRAWDFRRPWVVLFSVARFSPEICCPSFPDPFVRSVDFAVVDLVRLRRTVVGFAADP